MHLKKFVKRYNIPKYYISTRKIDKGLYETAVFRVKINRYGMTIYDDIAWDDILENKITNNIIKAIFNHCLVAYKYGN